MKKQWYKIFMVAFLCSLLVVMSSGFASQNDEDAEILEAAVQADSVLLQTGVVPAGILKRELNRANAVSLDSMEKAANEIAQQDRPDYGQSYFEERAEQLREIDEAIINDLDFSELTVDSGVMQYHLVSAKSISETEKQIKTSGVSWLTTIYYRNSKFIVNVLFNRDTATHQMLFQDGFWKVSKTFGMEKEFAPENYVPAKGSFSTMQEALNFVEQIDIDAENPF